MKIGLRWLKPNWWRLMRISLRVLLLLVVLLAIPLARLVNRVHRQRVVVDQICGHGGSVVHLGGADDATVIVEPGPWQTWLRAYLGDDYFDDVVSVEIGGRGGEEDLIAVAGGLPKMTAVQICSREVSARGLRALSRLPWLETLVLDRATLGQEERLVLGSLGRVHDLLLAGARLDGDLAFIEHLPNLCARRLRH